MALQLGLSLGHHSLPPPGPCCHQGGEGSAPQNHTTALPSTVKVPVSWDARAVGRSVPVAPWLNPLRCDRCYQKPGGPPSLGFWHHAGTFFCITPVQAAEGGEE